MFGWVGMVGAVMEGSAPAVQRYAVLTLDALTLAVAGWVIYRGARRGVDGAILLSIAIIAGLLASPHFYAQDLILVIPVLLVQLSTSRVTWPIALFAIAGWFVAFTHFAVLSATHINLVTLYLLALLSWLITEAQVFTGTTTSKSRSSALGSEVT
jgi:hypothetical protein